MSHHPPRERLADLTTRWHVDVEEVRETASSLVAFGRRGNAAVVLKVIKSRSDEWNSGAVLEALAGPTVVRVLEQEPGVVLTERAVPGTSLVDVVLDGRGDEATQILGDLIAGMPTVEALASTPTVEAWGSAFEWYLASGAVGIPTTLVRHASAVFHDLCATQKSQRLLHGDLQHSNVLFDEGRGWIVIDAKGIAGELEYEMGAALRNPGGVPRIVTDLETLKARLARLCGRLNLDPHRTAGWAFAQAVLSAVWTVQDGEPLQADCMVLNLAEVLMPLLHDRWGE